VRLAVQTCGDDYLMYLVQAEIACLAPSMEVEVSAYEVREGAASVCLAMCFPCCSLREDSLSRLGISSPFSKND